MKRPIIFTCVLLILGCGASDSRQTCVDHTEDLRLDCGVGVVYVEGAAALGDCSESVTCCQDTSHGDDVITARVRNWCDDLASCHVTASTWYHAENRGRTSLAVSYICNIRAYSRSGMKRSVDQLAELRVMPVIQTVTELCFGDTTIEITDAVYGVSPCNAYGNIRHCCPDPGDCTIPVEENYPTDHPDYYNEILVKCNNKRTCDDLQAQWISYISQWCTAVPDNTDYVTLHYMCLTATQTTEIIAVAVTVWMVYRKRRANTTSEESNTVGAQSPGVDNSIHLPEVEPLPQSPARMMTSHAPSGVDDVDPYYVNSQASPGFYDVIKPATEAYEPLQPYNRPEVAATTGDYVNVVDTTMEGRALYTELAPGMGVVSGKVPGEANTIPAMDWAMNDPMLVENHQYGTR